jgi:hypothetical protein
MSSISRSFKDYILYIENFNNWDRKPVFTRNSTYTSNKVEFGWVIVYNQVSLLFDIFDKNTEVNISTKVYNQNFKLHFRGGSLYTKLLLCRP